MGCGTSSSEIIALKKELREKELEAELAAVKAREEKQALLLKQQEETVENMKFKFQLERQVSKLRRETKSAQAQEEDTRVQQQQQVDAQNLYVESVNHDDLGLEYDPFIVHKLDGPLGKVVKGFGFSTYHQGKI